MQDEYENGFVEKCAAYGIDPEALLKAGQTAAPAPAPQPNPGFAEAAGSVRSTLGTPPPVPAAPPAPPAAPNPEFADAARSVRRNMASPPPPTPLQPNPQFPAEQPQTPNPELNIPTPRPRTLANRSADAADRIVEYMQGTPVMGGSTWQNTVDRFGRMDSVRQNALRSALMDRYHAAQQGGNLSYTQRNAMQNAFDQLGMDTGGIRDDQQEMLAQRRQASRQVPEYYASSTPGQTPLRDWNSRWINSQLPTGTAPSPRADYVAPPAPQQPSTEMYADNDEPVDMSPLRGLNRRWLQRLQQNAMRGI